MLSRSLGPEHLNVADGLSNLGSLYRREGKFEEAKPLYQWALSIWEKSLGPEHPSLATGLHGLALVYHDQANYEESEPLLERASHGGNHAMRLGAALCGAGQI
jgi:tetratricopeptide (TPR) repeat protein